jgi:cytochrome c-type biogenesis protein CcmH
MKNDLVGTDVSRPRSAVDIPTGRNTSVPTADTYKASFFILIGVVFLIAALWSYMAFTASTHQTLDQHVQNLGAQLKCPVCQGESVADSTSDRAQEIRAIIRQQIQAGQSDQQIIQYFSDRYGTQIVWSPPWWGFSLLAWLVPIALFIGGLVLIFFTLRDWRMPTVSIATNVAGQNTSSVTREDDAELATFDETELAQYRVQLERELASEDALFEQSGNMEAR